MAEPGPAPDIGLSDDPAPSRVDGKIKPGSHVKLYLPNLPYLAISHAVNGALLRPANNVRGWQYDLATSHKQLSDTVWEFSLRRDASFQDGSHFNADDVIDNMAEFKKAPFTFSKLHLILDRVEKRDDYTVRFHLSEPYGAFLYDVIWLQFYTRSYLDKFGWNGKPTCPNLAEPGPYALGPYILHEGYIEGDRSSKEVVLKANPNYWGDDKAKVETITIYTDLTLAQARDKALKAEGDVDITPVSFGDQLDTVLSPYAKLAESTSLNNYSMHFNMINGNAALLDERIRFAVNHAINKEYLLNLSMLGAGVLSPTMVSPHFYRVDNAISSLREYFEQQQQAQNTSLEALRELVLAYQREQGVDPQQQLVLTLFTQESFKFLTGDIQFFLSRVNIDLRVEFVPSEKMVFARLFNTWRGINKPWDFLLWGNFDWYKHPWAAFFVYRPFNDWSSIPPNPELSALTDLLLSTDIESPEYEPVLAKLIQHVHQHNYMVFLPTPNSVFAVNKEVVFNPGRSAFVYLRELQVTDDHWSVRGDIPYSERSKSKALKINRQNF
ncbi:ABC transporter substrate-binding protein [Corallincola platygyrae]|uniref:ABC transporter substrate-binding protein n=1 Tax=Corallincola platygyrae TaxID=1193278 RepID=A0ABW4XHV4_9GAMM